MDGNLVVSANQRLKGKVPVAGSHIEVRPTICAICNPFSHCGIDAYVQDGTIIKIEGTKNNPHSGGTLCAKGSASRQYIYHKDRLRTPLVRKGKKGSDEFEPVSWKEALDLIAQRLLKIKEKSGPESVVFYAGYTKWMRPFLKRLAHSFGSPNYATESSTCYQSGRPAELRVFRRTGSSQCKMSFGLEQQSVLFEYLDGSKTPGCQRKRAENH